MAGRPGELPLEALQRFLRDAEYRGPDSGGAHWIREIGRRREVFLGFNRLAVQDLTTGGDQPMRRGHHTLLYNGELSNGPEVRAWLVSHGHSLVTTSDTELVLELFRQLGTAAFSRIRGMYAIVVYDHETGEITLARDPIGIKPLFYAVTDRQLVFGSQALAVAAASGTRQIDVTLLRRLVVLDTFVGWANETPFTGVGALEPGTWVRFDDNLHASRGEFWSASSFLGAETPTAMDVRDQVADAVASHLVADVPIAAALSGGIDSSSIVVFASERGVDLATFCFSDDADTPTTFTDDATFAQRVRAMARGEVTLNLLRHRDDAWTLDRIDSYVAALGVPIHDDRVVVWDQLYSATREAGRVVFLNGQGADELWYGYVGTAWKWISVLFDAPLSRSSLGGYYDNRLADSAITPLISQWATVQECDRIVDSVYEALESTEGNDAQKLTVLLARTVLRALLHFEDALSLLNSVEVRVPLLDERLVEMALSIAPEAHLHEGPKSLLRSAMTGLLPDEVRLRPKAPLPKPRQASDALLTIYRDAIPEIRRSSLVRELYDVKNLALLAADQARAGEFYGGRNDAILQVLSTWRLEELCGI